MDDTKAPLGFQTRKSPADGIEDFPTPHWATRAFVEHCLPEPLSELTAWEPCANRGYMVSTLREYFGTVIGSDVQDYGAGFPVMDFLTGTTPMAHGMDVDFIVTNPPFNKAEEFFHRWYSDMPEVEHLCMLLRLSWLEGWSRFDNIFSKHNPAWVCPYSGRVAIVRGRLDRTKASQMPYAWFVWDRSKSKYQMTRIKWIPAKRADWEREGDWT